MFVFFIFGLQFFVRCRNLFVDSTSGTATNCDAVPCSFVGAISFSQAGDRIFLSDGVYLNLGRALLPRHSLTFLGADRTTTILQGDLEFWLEDTLGDSSVDFEFNFLTVRNKSPSSRLFDFPPGCDLNVLSVTFREVSFVASNEVSLKMPFKTVASVSLGIIDCDFINVNNIQYKLIEMESFDDTNNQAQIVIEGCTFLNSRFSLMELIDVDSLEILSSEFISHENDNTDDAFVYLHRSPIDMFGSYKFENVNFTDCVFRSKQFFLSSMEPLIELGSLSDSFSCDLLERMVLKDVIFNNTVFPQILRGFMFIDNVKSFEVNGLEFHDSVFIAANYSDFLVAVGGPSWNVLNLVMKNILLKNFNLVFVRLKKSFSAIVDEAATWNVCEWSHSSHLDGFVVHNVTTSHDMDVYFDDQGQYRFWPSILYTRFFWFRATVGVDVFNSDLDAASSFSLVNSEFVDVSFGSTFCSIDSTSILLENNVFESVAFSHLFSFTKFVEVDVKDCNFLNTRGAVLFKRTKTGLQECRVHISDVQMQNCDFDYRFFQILTDLMSSGTVEEEFEIYQTGGLVFQEVYRSRNSLSFYDDILAPPRAYTREEWQQFSFYISEFYDEGVLIEDSSFIGMAGDSGSALTFKGRNVVLIERCVFENNQVSTSGGAIYVSGESLFRGAEPPVIEMEMQGLQTNLMYFEYYPTSFGFRIIDSKFHNNAADYYGGHIYGEGTDLYLEVKNSNFSAGSAKFGADCYFFLSQGMKFENVVFAGGNVLSEDSSEVFASSVVMSTVDFVFKNVKIMDVSGGSCLYVGHGSFNLNTCSFLKCEYGALSLVDIQKRRKNDDITQYDCVVSGVILTESILVARPIDNTIGECEFKDNGERAVKGGALTLKNNLFKIAVEDSLFVGNSANLFGGSLFLKDTQKLHLNNTEVRSSTAMFGAFVAVEESSLQIGSNVRVDGAASLGGSFLFDNSRNQRCTFSQFEEDVYSECAEVSNINTQFGGWFSSRPDDVVLVADNSLDSDVFKVFPGEKFDVIIQIFDRIGQVMLGYPDLICRIRIDENSKSVLTAANYDVVLGDEDGQMIFRDLKLDQGEKSVKKEKLFVQCTEIMKGLEISVEFVECEEPTYGLNCLEQIKSAAYTDYKQEELHIEFSIEESVFSDDDIVTFFPNSGELDNIKVFDCCVFISDCSSFGEDIECSFTSTQFQYYRFTEHLIIHNVDTPQDTVGVIPYSDKSKVVEKEITTPKRPKLVDDSRTGKVVAGVLIPILLVFGLAVLIGIAVILIILRIVKSQKKEIKRFGELDDFDILLQEQKLERSGKAPTIKLEKESLQVDPNSVKLISLLGEGGQSSVYLAEFGGQKYAYKVFKTNQMMGSGFNFDEFEREGIFGVTVSGRIVSSVFWFIHRVQGILTEFCKGGDLYTKLKASIVRNIPISVHEKFRILIEVASALEFIHSKNIWHRDLKLENIMLDENVSVKLIDFGFARKVERGDSLTVRVGTSQYMEMIANRARAKQYTEKIDIYSFSLVSFMCLTDELLPYGEDFSEMEVYQNDLRPDIKLLPDEVPSSVVDMIQTCWKRNPSERLSAKKVREVLIDAKKSELKSSEFDSLMQEKRKLERKMMRLTRRIDGIGGLGDNKQTIQM